MSVAYDSPVSFSEFLTELAKVGADKTFELALNDEYTAKVNVTKGTVKVGCQTFQVSKIQELCKKVEEMS